MDKIDGLLKEFATTFASGDAAERRATEAGLAALRSAVVAETGRKRRFPLRSRVRELAIGGCVMAVFLAVVVLVDGGGDLGGAPASAAVVLERAAGALQRMPWSPLNAGEYYYIRSAANYPSSGSASTRPFETDEAWIASDGSGRLVQRAATGTDVIPFGVRQQRSSGPPQQQPWRWAGLDYRQLIHLPTEPSALLRWVQARAPNYGQQPPRKEAFTMVGDLLREAPLPPELRAAMFRVVARLPGVQLVGQTRDELGRVGVAVGLAVGTVREDLIFQPATGTLLGERTISLGVKSGAPPGTTLGWNVIEVEGVVHSDHQRPARAAYRG
jgi:hypothetical protein